MRVLTAGILLLGLLTPGLSLADDLPASYLVERRALRSGAISTDILTFELYDGWCVLGFSEADFWTHAAIDDAFCISYSTGVSMPSAECLR